MSHHGLRKLRRKGGLKSRHEAESPSGTVDSAKSGRGWIGSFPGLRAKRVMTCCGRQKSRTDKVGRKAGRILMKLALESRLLQSVPDSLHSGLNAGA